MSIVVLKAFQTILGQNACLALIFQDQGAFLSEFETKALQVATQTAQPAKPEVVEVVKVGVLR